MLIVSNANGISVYPNVHSLFLLSMKNYRTSQYHPFFSFRFFSLSIDSIHVWKKKGKERREKERKGKVRRGKERKKMREKRGKKYRHSNANLDSFKSEGCSIKSGLVAGFR